ncbi:hypothetical protein ABIF97_005786 [Bradyrhizobium japonicum]
MPLPEPPKIAAVEVVAAQPTEADRAAIAPLGVTEPKAVYVVKVKLEAKPPVTSMAWALYVNDELVSKYWEYADGIYFTVTDPQFFTRHQGKQLRFSQNGTDFFDTGVKLMPAPSVADGNAIGLPLQADVLK